MARPPKPAEKVRTYRMNVACTRKEREMIRSLADPIGVSDSELVRYLVRRAYEERSKKTKAA